MPSLRGHMIRSLKLAVLVIVLCGISITCGSSPTVTGNQLPLDGTWTVSMTADDGGTGTATVVLMQTGIGVSGTFSIASPGSPLLASGIAGGTVSGASVALFLTPSRPLACS